MSTRLGCASNCVFGQAPVSVLQGRHVLGGGHLQSVALVRQVALRDGGASSRQQRQVHGGGSSSASRGQREDPARSWPPGLPVDRTQDGSTHASLNVQPASSPRDFGLSVPTIRWTDSLDKAQALSLPLPTATGLFLWNILTNLVIY